MHFRTYPLAYIYSGTDSPRRTAPDSISFAFQQVYQMPPHAVWPASDGLPNIPAANHWRSSHPPNVVNCQPLAAEIVVLRLVAMRMECPDRRQCAAFETSLDDIPSIGLGQLTLRLVVFGDQPKPRGSTEVASTRW